MGSLNSDVSRRPPWARNVWGKGDPTLLHLVNTVVDPSSPRAMHTSPSPLPGRIRYLGVKGGFGQVLAKRRVSRGDLLYVDGGKDLRALCIDGVLSVISAS